MERTDGTEAIYLDLLIDPLLVHDPIDVDQPMFQELGDEMVLDGAAESVVDRLLDVWSLERLELFKGERVEPDVLVHHERVVQQFRLFLSCGHLHFTFRAVVAL